MGPIVEARGDNCQDNEERDEPRPSHILALHGTTRRSPARCRPARLGNQGIEYWDKSKGGAAPR